MVGGIGRPPPLPTRGEGARAGCQHDCLGRRRPYLDMRPRSFSGCPGGARPPDLRRRSKGSIGCIGTASTTGGRPLASGVYAYRLVDVRSRADAQADGAAVTVFPTGDLGAVEKSKACAGQLPWAPNILPSRFAR